MNAPARLRVAMTLEQFWHRVPGGTAVAAFGMARALANDDLDLIGVTARHGGPPQERWALPIQMTELFLPRRLLYESWHRLRWPRVERATGTVDVIHATTLAVPPRSAPLVVTIHDLAWIEYPAHFTRRGLAFFRRGLASALRDADLVLCPSQATLEACRNRGFEESRLRLVPLGVAVETTSDEDLARVRARYELSGPYIMWTGTIEPRKNLRGLVAAYASLETDHDLVLVGPKGWNEDIDSVVRVSGAQRLRSKVKALGFVPEEDLRALYAGAEVFCYPSLLEGFGFPVLEAMAQGTPVVTSIATSTQELATDAAVLVDPKSPNSIAEGLASVLSDPGFAARLATEGRARAAEYPWSRTAGLLQDAYREVAQG